ncbi:MAG: ATPase [Euryarchaeota archaeon]|nr:ATPase [Euryarchaeota archaeon]
MSSYLDIKIEKDELSERLGGGLPRGSLICLEAPYGAGKSILSQRVLYGLLKNNHTVGVASTELTTLGFIEQMNSMDYPIEEFLLSGDLVFLPVYPLVGNRQVPPDLLYRLRNAAPLYSKEVVIIDTLSKLLTDQQRVFRENPQLVVSNGGRAGREATPEERLVLEVEETIYHMKRLAASGKTFIVTLEPDGLSPDILSLFREVSDVHISLDFNLVGNAAARRIIVNRFSRAKNRFGDVIGYRVEPGVGLVIEIKSVT